MNLLPRGDGSKDMVKTVVIWSGWVDRQPVEVRNLVAASFTK